MNRPATIRARLTLWYSFILAVSMAVLGFGLWFAIRASIRETTDNDLLLRSVKMVALLNALHNRAEITEEMGEQALASSGTEARVVDRSGQVLFASPGASTWKLDPAPGSSGATVLHDAILNGSRFRLLTTSFQGGVAELGIPTQRLEAVLGTLTWTMLLGSPVVLLLAAFGGYWMSGRALEPVHSIADAAQRISAERLSDRLSLRGTGDELDRLSASLNAMFERLEAGLKRVRRFTADASHELRTPAAIILMTAEIAKNRPRTIEEHLKYWDRVLEETGRIGRLLDDLLLLARADDQVIPARMEPVDLAGCAQEAYREVLVLAERAGIELTVLADSPAEIAGDAEALRRLVVILLDNAIKYTPSGGTVHLLVFHRGDTVDLEIRDTGMGIDPEHQAQIFDRFYRVHEDRSRQSGGTGLGLAIAQSIARQHGASITVHSAPGSGSIFGVRFPALTRSVLPVASGNLQDRARQ